MLMITSDLVARLPESLLEPKLHVNLKIESNDNYTPRNEV